MQFQFVSVAAIVALIASTTAAPIPMDIYQQMQANKQAEIDAWFWLALLQIPTTNYRHITHLMVV